MGRTFGPVVGSRRLLRDGSREATIVLGKPRRTKRGSDWECPFRIEGLTMRGIKHGYGVDAIQALTTALEGIRTMLEGCGERLSWIGGYPGDPGFERPVPSGLGMAFAHRLNRMIDREVAQFLRAQERRHKRQNSSTSKSQRRRSQPPRRIRQVTKRVRKPQG